MIFALKLTKFPSFTQNLPENARILHYDCPKIFFLHLIFFFGGGMDRGNPIAPVSYAYGWAPGPPPAKSGPGCSLCYFTFNCYEKKTNN